MKTMYILFVMEHNSKKFFLFITLFLSIFGVSFISGCGGGGSSSSSPFLNNVDVVLRWDAPRTNVDGTPLTDLAGYKIYYGALSRNYTVVKDIQMPTCKNLGSNLTECAYSVENLVSGIWYFAVTAYDTSMNESDYSNEVSRIIK